MLSTLMRHTFRTSLVAGFGLLAQSAIADLYIDQATRDANGNITLSGWSDAPVTGITVNGAAASVSTDTMAEETVYRFEYSGANSDQLTVVAQETTGGTEQAILDFTSGQAIDNALQIKVDGALIDTLAPMINQGLADLAETVNTTAIDFVQPVRSLFYETTYTISAINLDGLTMDLGLGGDNADAFTFDSSMNIGGIQLSGVKEQVFCLFGCVDTMSVEPFTLTITNTDIVFDTAISANNGALSSETTFTVTIDREGVTAEGLTSLEEEIIKIAGVILEYPAIQEPITEYVNTELTNILAIISDGLAVEKEDSYGATAAFTELSTSNNEAIVRMSLTPYDNKATGIQYAARLTDGAQTDIANVAFAEGEQFAIALNDDMVNHLVATTIQNSEFGQTGYSIGYDASPLEETMPFIFDSDSWITTTVTLESSPYLAASENADVRIKMDMIRINVLASDLNPLFRDIEFTVEAGLDFEADIALVEYETETGTIEKGIQITNKTEGLVGTKYGVTFSRYTLYNNLLESVVDNSLDQVLQDVVDNLPVIPLNVLSTASLDYTASIDGGEDADVVLAVGFN